MIKNWEKYFCCSSYLPSAIFSQFLWFNSNIKVVSKSVFTCGFGNKNTNFVGKNFHCSGKTKSWGCIKSEYNLEFKLKYHWIQLTDTLPILWKNGILSCRGNSMYLCIFDYHLIKIGIFDHHLIKKNNLYCLNKLGSTELYQRKCSESTKNHLCSCTIKIISTILISTGSQYIFYHTW